MSTPRRILLSVAGLGVVALAATGCLPESAPTSTTPAASPSSSPSEASPSPTPTEVAFAFPASCDDFYSADMRALLDADVPPLNDPGTTMLSTENVDGLDILAAAGQTIRCSWGPPSERGMATNVTIVTADQSETLASSFVQSGFSEEEFDGGRLLRISGETLTLGDEIVEHGETHYLRDDVWISTRWINVAPDGYTEDIVTTLWG